MNILGISCFYHDSAACLLKDGEIVAAAQEERFDRRKNSFGFPIRAINFCIQAGNLSPYDIDYAGFYEKPFEKFSRVIWGHLRSYPFSCKNFLSAMPVWLQDRLILPLVLNRELDFKGEVIFIKHHLAHAASSFLVSPFEEAAILTADGVGEWATTSFGVGKGVDIRILKEIHFPDSLGLLYTAVTTYLGFEALEGEGKVMGLAGYGKPRYLDRLKEMVEVKSDGSFRLNQKFFGFFNSGSRMYTPRFIKALGKERRPDDKIDERHCDIAASVQKLIEDILVKMANNLYQEARLDKLCLSGGLFLNCVANHKILEKSPFKEVFIQPGAGDCGGALGVAAYIYHVLLQNKRNYRMTNTALGPAFSVENIKKVLLQKNLAFREMEYPSLFGYVAKKIAENNIVGWFQGRMEFGPRALGNRSILANPCNPQMKDILNSRVKHREHFRPYAPVVLEEAAGEYFDLKSDSPFMLLAARVKEGKRGLIPAVTHVDGTARVQTVSKNADPRLRQLIKEFERITGIPMLINTSFNLKGEPIVCSPEDAVSGFLKSEMDCLVLENIIVERMDRIQDAR